MIKLADLLREAKQVGTIYHHTIYYNASNIVGTGKLCSSNDPFEDGTYGISFTRDKAFHGKFTSNEGGSQCRFVIDGDKLSQNYKIRPYAEEESNPRAESEEQIRQKKWFCIPILKYVTSIDVLGIPRDDFDQKHYDKLIQLSKEKGIKVVKSF